MESNSLPSKMVQITVLPITSTATFVPWMQEDSATSQYQYAGMFYSRKQLRDSLYRRAFTAHLEIGFVIFILFLLETGSQTGLKLTA